ncbi:anti-Muellerian hormone type-2 receptor-like [Periophthalmus magnuspinnatus]|uniref:anti-Muellerian hormone type-2 receptor-like n=1 Tax=Periophthalmus magnuspinnatus TaxID=409849 RepID=UPI002436EDC2|nr:anti-Muellerian hormone type-2 receptor-like [Periophthalmus magnuspinnatus]
MALLWRHWWPLVECVFLSITHRALSQKRRCFFQVKRHSLNFHGYGFVNGSEQYCNFTDCCVGYYIIKNGELEVESLGCYLTEKSCSDLSCSRTLFDRNHVRCVCNGDFCNSNITWSPDKPLPLTDSYDFNSYECANSSLHDPLCVKPSDSDIEIQLQQILCKGTFAAVWKGSYQGSQVAVKLFPLTWRHKFTAEREIYQLPLMAQTGIVQFLGSGSIGPWEALVLQFVKHGSLHSYLSTHTSNWTSSLVLCQSLSQGLSYLHSDLHKDGVHKPPVAHRDLSSSNVLVTADGTCVLSDFGCSTILRSEQTGWRFYSRKLEVESPMGTLRYMSPEILQGSVNLNSDWCLQGDIYSLGLVLWEIWMRCSSLFDGERAPLHLLPYEFELGAKVSLENLLHYVFYMDQRPEIPKVWEQHPQGAALKELLSNCWDSDGDARISASLVVNRLASFE